MKSRENHFGVLCNWCWAGHECKSFSFDVTLFIALCFELTTERTKGRKAESAQMAYADLLL